MPNKKILGLVLIAAIFAIPAVVQATIQDGWSYNTIGFEVPPDDYMGTWYPVYIYTYFYSRASGGKINVNTNFGGSNHVYQHLQLHYQTTQYYPNGAQTSVYIEQDSVATAGQVQVWRYNN